MIQDIANVENFAISNHFEIAGEQKSSCYLKENKISISTKQFFQQSSMYVLFCW